MDFTKLDRYLTDLKTDFGILGCSISVSVKGKRVFEKCYGTDDCLGSNPTSPDTVYQLYSMTKVFTSCAALQLIEKGILHLDDAVSRWLPAFARLTYRKGGEVLPCKNTLTVRHLLSMQGGFDYDIREPLLLETNRKAGGNAATRQIIDALAAKPLLFEPGTHFAYSLCHDVLGAVIEEASGMRFAEYVKQNIFLPLGIHNMAFHQKDLPHPENMSALWFHMGKDKPPLLTDGHVDFIFSESYDSGGAGLCGTCEDYMKLAETIACGGKLPDGGYLLKPETVSLWHENQQLTEQTMADFAPVKPGYGYGLGVRTYITPDAVTPVGEFGWDGAAGSYVSMDTATQTAFVYMQNMPGCADAIPVIQPTLRDMVYEQVRNGSSSADGISAV